MIRRLAVLAFFSLAAAGSVSAQTVLLFDWRKWCEDGQPKTCHVDAIARNGSNELLQITTEFVNGKASLSMNVMRGSLGGSKTAAFNLDKGKPVKLDVKCGDGASLCTLDTPLTAEMMSAFKKSSVFSVSVPVSKLQFDVPLTSFAAAVDGEGMTREQYGNYKEGRFKALRQ